VPHGGACSQQVLRRGNTTRKRGLHPPLRRRWRPWFGERSASSYRDGVVEDCGCEDGRVSTWSDPLRGSQLVVSSVVRARFVVAVEVLASGLAVWMVGAHADLEVAPEVGDCLAHFTPQPFAPARGVGENRKYPEPLGRPGQPGELAVVYVLLASYEASCISGARIAVTGGRSIL
jgi:hypothetical protein